MEALLDTYMSLLGGSEQHHSEDLDMDDDDTMSLSESPAESGALTPDQTALEKQFASLQSYLKSVPYDCESNDVMQAKLEAIVAKIFVCARAKNWLVLTTWDGMLQW